MPRKLASMCCYQISRSRSIYYIIVTHNILPYSLYRVFSFSFFFFFNSSFSKYTSIACRIQRSIYSPISKWIGVVELFFLFITSRLYWYKNFTADLPNSRKKLLFQFKNTNLYNVKWMHIPWAKRNKSKRQRRSQNQKIKNR